MRRRSARSTGWSRLVLPLGTAKLGRMLASRCAGVAVCAGLGSRAVWGAAMAIPGTAQTRLGRLRRVWRGAWRGDAGWWRTVRPPVHARGGGREQRVGLLTWGPRPCAVRQACAAWGQPPRGWPCVLAQPGRTRQEPPRRWQGHRVVRRVPVEDAAGRLDVAALRVLVVHASPLAHQAAVA